MSRWWFVLAVFRVLLTLWPQTGYIHPDEFFQTVEIASGDIFGLDTLRTWEFNSSFPVRSIVPIYLISGPPLLVLRTLEDFGLTGVVTSYALLIMPRIVMLALSFFLDLCVFRITEVLGGNVQSGMCLVASSYVTLVYYTRTFSNSFEGILFAMLLLLTFGQNRRSGNFRNPVTKEERLTDKQRTLTGSVSPFRIAVVIVVGLFNRPTFAAFAAVPYLSWLLSGVQTHNKFSFAKVVFWKAACSFASAAFVCSIFVVCDSIYFGHLSPNFFEMASAVQDLGLSDFLMRNFTLTPLNFLVYNMQVDNLASHGIHPRYTHVLVNIQLLFCILGVVAAKDLIRLTFSSLTKCRQSVFSPVVLVHLSYVVPVLFLSCFPHQEPRFLIPLVCPLVALSSRTVFEGKFWKHFRILWIIFNVFGLLFFGFFHQAGLIPAISKLQADHVERSASQTVKVVFWRTYMPPRYLFMLRNPLPTKHVDMIHDLAGASNVQLLEVLTKFKHSSRTDDVFLLSPGTLHHRLQRLLTNFDIRVMDKFCPHFSGEDLLSLDHVYCTTNSDSSSSDCSQSFWKRISNALSLYVYRVNFKN